MNSRKRILIVILIFIVLSLVGWMVYSSIMTIKAKEEMTSRISEVPEFQFLSMDSSFVSVKSNFDDSPLVILYFNTECEYCQSEVLDIVENKDELENINLLHILIHVDHPKL